ncbi:MAG: hypothetical protein ACK5RO_01965 [Pseudobdellovibrionaceae bacterium]
MRWSLLCCFLLLCFSSHAQFQYQPVNPSFWLGVLASEADPKNNDIVPAIQSRLRRSSPDSLEYSEALLGMAKIMKRDGLTFAATLALTEVIRNRQGTSVANQSLIELQEIIKKYPSDLETLIGDLVLDIDYEKPPQEVQDFVSFFSGQFNLRRGFKNWSEKDFKQISVGSYWDFRMKYIRALEDVKNEKIDSAIERFASLANNESVPESIRNDAAHQYARLVFEKGDYEQAYNTLLRVSLNPRESGLLLLERAWSKYYLQDYGKSLGHLTALEAPIFDASRSPEAYVLKMLIYKELCYYEAAFSVMDEFKKRFSNSIDAIRKRKNLKQDQMLVNAALLDERLGSLAQFYNLLKDERMSFKDSVWSSGKLGSKMLRDHDLKLSELRAQLNFHLTGPIREVANDLLDWQEQISFLDYQTRVDALRVISVNSFKPLEKKEVPLTQFNQIFWRFTGEFWLDELESLNVNVESQCGKGRGAR